MIDIKLSDDHRLTTDGQQFIVLERRIVDPTQAPNWERRLAEAKARGEEINATVREEWREIAYYGMKPASLVLALELVTLRTAAHSDAKSLEEFAEIIQTESQRIATALEAVISRGNQAVQAS